MKITRKIKRASIAELRANGTVDFLCRIITICRVMGYVQLNLFSALEVVLERQGWLVHLWRHEHNLYLRALDRYVNFIRDCINQGTTSTDERNRVWNDINDDVNAIERAICEFARIDFNFQPRTPQPDDQQPDDQPQ